MVNGEPFLKLTKNIKHFSSQLNHQPGESMNLIHYLLKAMMYSFKENLGISS